MVAHASIPHLGDKGWKSPSLLSAKAPQARSCLNTGKKKKKVGGLQEFKSSLCNTTQPSLN